MTLEFINPLRYKPGQTIMLNGEMVEITRTEVFSPPRLLSERYKDEQQVIPDPDYKLIPKLPQQYRGVQCGECGMKFDHDKIYGYVCGQANCPIQSRVTS